MKNFNREENNNYQKVLCQKIKNVLARFSKSAFVLLVMFLSIGSLHAQSGGWDGSSISGNPGYTDRGNGVIQLMNTINTGCAGSAVHETSATYDPNSGGNFSQCYKVFFACPGNDNIGSDSKGDGLAFSFWKGGYDINNGGCGGGLGYHGANAKMITIEFDTWSSQGSNGFDASYGGGTSGNNDEISIQKDGNSSDGGRITSVNAGNLEDGKEHSVCITYVSSTHVLSVTIDGTTKLSYDLGGNNLLSYFGAGGLNQSWSAGKYGATLNATVSNGASIATNAGGAVGLPTPTIANKAICVGGTAATFDAGAGFSSYLWSVNGTGTAQTTSGTTAGNYTCTVTNSGGCSASATGVLTVNPLPTPSIANKSICAGAAAATFDAGAGYTAYLWSANGTGTAQITSGTTAGNYTCQVTNSNGCKASATGVLTVNALPTTPSIANKTICAGDPAASFDAGAGYSSYLWSGNGTGTARTTSGTAAGNYTCQVTNANGCKATGTGVLTVNTLPSVTIANKSICTGGAAATFDAGAGYSAYLWSGNGTGTAQTTTGSTAGNYTCQVTNSNGCKASATGVLTINTIPVVSISGKTICAGASTTFDAGNAGATYAWTGPGGFTSTIQIPTVSVAGTYSVTVTKSGCSASGSAVLTVNSNPTVSIANQTICSGQSATFDAGAGFTSYSWNTSPVSTTRTITVNTAGTYTATVTNSNGCTGTGSATLTINSGPVLALSNQSICSGGTTIFNAGSGFSSYLWNTGSTASSIVASTAGTYSVTVGNVSGCTTTASATLALTSPSSGGWDANNSSGNTGYTDWGNGVVQLQNATNTGCAGSAVHETSVKYDPNSGANFSQCYKVFFACPGSDNIGNDSKGDGMAFSFSTGAYNINNGACGGGLGYHGASAKMITIEFDTWSSQGTNGFDGSYGGGTLGNNDEIAIHKDGNSNDAGRLTSVNAGNLEDGLEHTVCITYIAATHILSVAIDGNTKLSYDLGSTYNLQNYFSGLGALNQSWSTGKYGATMPSTVSSCANINSIAGSAVGLPSPTIANKAICFGQTTTFDAGSYSAYIWSANGSGTAQTTSAATAGNYTCTVTNSAGCSASATGVLTINPLPTPSIDGKTVCPGSTATFDAGTGYTAYLWSNNGTGTAQTTSGNTAGNYTCQVTNSNGCKATATGVLSMYTSPTITISSAASSICFGKSTQLTASGASTYVWSPSTGLSNSNIASPIAKPLQTTTYTVVGTDANGCTNSAAITIVVTPKPHLKVVSTSYQGTSVQLTASGAANYTWSPSTGLSSSNIFNPIASPSATTAYTVIGADTLGCTDTAQTTVTKNGKYYLISHDISCGSGNGDAEVMVSTRVSNLTYNWQPEPWSGQGSAKAMGLSAGQWCVAITDTIVHDTNTVCFTIGTSAPMSWGSTHSLNTCSTCSEGEIGFFTTGGKAPYKYSINGGNSYSSNNLFLHLNTGIYPVVFMDADSCRLDSTITIKGDVLTLSSVVTSNKNWIYPASGAVNLTITGGVGPYTISWNTGSETEDLTELTAGTYDVTVTDAIGSTASLTSIVYNEIKWEQTSGLNTVNGLLVKTGGDNWTDGFASSEAKLGADSEGSISLQVVSTTNPWKVGFADVTAALADNISYGFYNNSGTLEIIENGQSVGQYGALAVNDKLIITKTLTGIDYIKNGVTLRAFTETVTAPIGDLLLKLNIFKAGVAFAEKSGVTFGAQKSLAVFTRVKRNLDGTYLQVKDETLRFIYNEEYGVSNSLNYKVYDSQNNVVLSNKNYSITVKKGANKIEISCLNKLMSAGKYYVLEITNEKNEKMYLRFIDISLSPCVDPVNYAVDSQQF